MKSNKYSELTDDELLSVGLKLMRLSIEKIFDMYAIEHEDYEEYMVELDRRNHLNEY